MRPLTQDELEDARAEAYAEREEERRRQWARRKSGRSFLDPDPVGWKCGDCGALNPTSTSWCFGCEEARRG